VVDLRAVAKGRGQVPLKGLHLGLEGADPAVELTVGEDVREVRAEVDVGEPEEVTLAPEAGPLGEDGEGEYLARSKQRRMPGPAGRVPMVLPPPVVHQHEQGN